MGGSARFRTSRTKNINRFSKTLSDEEIKIRSAEIRASHKYTSDFSQKIRDAKTIDELMQAVYEKYGKSDDEFPYVVLRARNMEMVKRVLVTLDELENEYPFAKGIIYNFGSASNDSLAGFTLSSGKLGLSIDWNDEDSPSLYSGKIRGDSIPNTTPESIIAHEFGHAIQARIFQKLHPDLFTNGKYSPPNNEIGNKMILEYRNGKFMMEVEKKVLKKLNIGFYEAHSRISNYARDEGVMEAFSEAFSDVYANGENASAVSKAYVQALLEAAR